MQQTSYTQIVLKADENKWLYNEEEQTFAKTVFLGKNASPNNWREITEEEYKKLSEQEEL